MKKELLERNIKYYYLFSIFCFTPIAIPILTVFWQNNGLTLSDIYLLEAIFSVIVVIIDVPMGMIADKIGKRTSIKYSTIMMFLGWISYASGSSFFAFLIAEIFLAIAQALISGADSSLLYETLKALDRENEFKRHEGRSRALQMYSFAVCNLIGGVIAHNFGSRIAVLATAIGPIISFFILTRILEVNKVQKMETLSQSWKEYKKLISSSFKFVLKHKLIQWNILFFSIITGSSVWLLWLYQPYMELTGLPIWFFGVAFAIFNFFAATMSGLSNRIIRNISTSKVYILLSVLQLLPLLLMSTIIGRFSFLFILGQQAVRGMLRPVISNEILKYTYSDKRATVLSLASLGSRLFFSITSPIFILIANDGIIKNIFMQFYLLIFFLFIMYFSYQKIPKKYFTVKDDVFDKQ